jgi:hypothetical protein
MLLTIVQVHTQLLKQIFPSVAAISSFPCLAAMLYFHQLTISGIVRAVSCEDVICFEEVPFFISCNVAYSLYL